MRRDRLNRARRISNGLPAILMLVVTSLAGCAVDGGMLAGSKAASRPSTMATPAQRDDASGSLTTAGEPKVATDLDPLATSEPTPGRRSTVKVALLLPISAPGPLAIVAKAMKQAGELALFDQSNADLQLIVKDDKGTPDGARAAAEEAVRDGAEMILGPLLSASVQAVAPVARSANVPVVAFSNDRQVAGSGVFLLSFMAEPEVDRIIGYAASKGRRNFAALLPDDAYGRILETAFTRAVARAQANVITVERYQGSGTGMLEPTRRLAEAMARSSQGAGQAAGPAGRDDAGASTDAVFLPGSPETLASLGPLLAYAKLDTTRIKLLGSGGWDTASVGRDPTLVGGWFPAPDQHGWQAFAEKFGKTFGSVPPRIATLAFDAVGVAQTLAGAPASGPGASTASGTGMSSRYTVAGLTRINGFTGADGQFRFHSDGTAARALAILEVQSFGSTTIDAPQPVDGAPGVSSSAAPGAQPPGAQPPGAQATRAPVSRLN